MENLSYFHSLLAFCIFLVLDFVTMEQKKQSKKEDKTKNGGAK